MAPQHNMVVFGVFLVCSAAAMDSCAHEGAGCGSLSLLQHKATVLHGKTMEASDKPGEKDNHHSIHPNNYVKVKGYHAVFDTVLQSNLAGKGPDKGKKEIRYGSVFKLDDGLNLDLVVTALTSYKPQKSKKNGLSGRFGQINIAGNQDLLVKFEWENSATKEPVTLDMFFMTVADVDHGTTDLREKVGIKDFEAAYLAKNSEILASVDKKGNHEFTSSEVDTTGDFNPTDPHNISGSDLRRIVVFEFMGKSYAKLRLSTPEGKTWAGRNFLFSAHSGLQSFCNGAASKTDLLRIPSESTLNMYLTKLLHSNLGGVGPDDGAQNMRFGEALPGVDLVVSTASPTYRAVLPEYNGLYGNAGRLNIQGGNYSAKLKFEFQNSTSGEPVEIRSFFFSFLDIDQAAGDTLHERITIRDYTWFSYMRDNLEYGVDDNGDTTFTSTVADAVSGADNPNNLDDLTHEQKQRAVTFEFRKKSSFTATIDTLGGTKSAPLPGTFQCPPCGPHSRSIMFGGYTNLAETTETTIQC